MKKPKGNSREHSIHSLFGVISIAEGLLCPSCDRAIQAYDFEPIYRFAFQINCGGCHRTLLAYEEPRR